MTFPFPYGGITATVERASFNRFNDVVYTPHHKVYNCTEYPSGSEEGPANTAITDARSLLAPPGSDILASDRMVLHAPGEDNPPPVGTPERQAVTYQVNGKPKDWTHAITGWHPGMSVDLLRVV